jgi:hypothetical protein
MFVEDQTWQKDDKVAVIEDLIKQNKRQRNQERKSTGVGDNSAEGMTSQPQEAPKRTKMFGRKKIDTYYGRQRL